MKHKKCMNPGWLFWDHTCSWPDLVQGLMDFSVYAFVSLIVSSRFILYNGYTRKNTECTVLLILLFLLWCMQEKCASMVGQAEDTCGALNSEKPNSSHDFKHLCFNHTQNCLCSSAAGTLRTSTIYYARREDSETLQKCMRAHVAALCAWCAWCAWSSIVSWCAEWLMIYSRMSLWLRTKWPFLPRL